MCFSVSAVRCVLMGYFCCICLSRIMVMLEAWSEPDEGTFFRLLKERPWFVNGYGL